MENHKILFVSILAALIYPSCDSDPFGRNTKKISETITLNQLEDCSYNINFSNGKQSYEVIRIGWNNESLIFFGKPNSYPAFKGDPIASWFIVKNLHAIPIELQEISSSEAAMKMSNLGIECTEPK